MNLQAICHRPKSNYAYAICDNTILIRIRTAKGDCKRVRLVIGVKHKWADKETYDMEKTASDHLFDYYQFSYQVRESQLGYYFLISDDTTTVVYSESGFSQKFDDENAYFHYFQYPYINEPDVHKVPEWVHKAVFYQIFVDRFARGNGGFQADLRPWGELPDPHSFYGGDLKGILDKLDYLCDLGINALYLTPIFKSPSNHKYDTCDYREVDPMFGDKETLVRLVCEAHKRGMRVVLDGVFNHCSWYLPQFQDVLRNGDKSKYKDWFYIESFPITRYSEKEVNDYSRPLDLSNLNYKVFATSPNMPKLNTENREIRQYLLDTVVYWMREAGLDGWRLDVSDEVSHDFWREFRKVVKQENPDTLILGENWHNAYPWLIGDQFDGVMNYPFTKSAIETFAMERKNAADLAADLSGYLMQNTWQAQNAMLNLLDSHDTMRFLTWCDYDEEKLKMAWMLMFTYVGMPCIYYGDEIGMSGKGDPDCRRTFEWDENKWNLDLHEFVKDLIHIRKKRKSLQYGGIKIYTEDEVFYLYREHREEKTLMVLNLTQKTIALERGWKCALTTRKFEDGNMNSTSSAIFYL